MNPPDPMHRFRPVLSPSATATLAVLAAAFCTPASAAFIVDQVQVKRVGDDAQLELQFTTEVQFQRVIATAAGDTVVVAYQLVGLSNREVGPGKEAFDIRLGSKGVPLVGDETRESWPSTYKVRERKR